MDLATSGVRFAVGYETMYKFAYSADGLALRLSRHLPERRSKR